MKPGDMVALHLNSALKAVVVAVLVSGAVVSEEFSKAMSGDTSLKAYVRPLCRGCWCGNAANYRRCSHWDHEQLLDKRGCRPNLLKWARHGLAWRYGMGVSRVHPAILKAIETSRMYPRV